MLLVIYPVINIGWSKVVLIHPMIILFMPHGSNPRHPNLKNTTTAAAIRTTITTRCLIRPSSTEWVPTMTRLMSSYTRTLYIMSSQ